MCSFITKKHKYGRNCEHRVPSFLSLGPTFNLKFETYTTLNKYALIFVHSRTTNLAGTLKKWCKKKKPLQQQLDILQEQIKTI
jgi:hypothetical protein